MKYTSIFPINTEINIYELLGKRGISDEDFYYFLNPEKENNLLDPFLLDNMDEAVKVVKKHIDLKSKIMIGVDPDADGFTSAAKLYRYLKNLYSDIDLEYFIHEHKIHGITDELMKLQYNLLIMPDGASSDVVQQKILIDKGVDVLVLDHHHSDFKSAPAIVVNNQLCNYPNKHLSGVGIVQKFCEAYDSTYGFNRAFDDLDLVAVGMVSDLMMLNNLEQIYYVSNGLNKIDNLLFLGIIASNAYTLGKVENLTPKMVGWNIGPVINAVIRVGTVEQKRKMFLGMLEKEDYKIPSTKRGNKTGDTEMLIGQICREATNARAKQKRIIEKNMPILIKSIEENNNVEEDGILFGFAKESKDLPTSMNGMLSMKLTEYYNRPVMVLKIGNDKDNVSGSGRSTDTIEGLREMLVETDLFNYASGR